MESKIIKLVHEIEQKKRVSVVKINFTFNVFVSFYFIPSQWFRTDRYVSGGKIPVAGKKTRI